MFNLKSILPIVVDIVLLDYIVVTTVDGHLQGNILTIFTAI